jgi:hypothetical protein
LKTARVAGGRMVLQVYFNAAKVGVGVGVGVGFPEAVVLVGAADGGADEVGEHPASAASVAIAIAPTAHRRAIEGPDMTSRIGQ